MALDVHNRRLRFLVLASLAIVVTVTLAAHLSRRRQRRQETPPPAPIAADVDQQTQAFSLSKTLADHTLYTIQAEQVTNFKDTGKALLHGVSIIIYGQDGSRRDRITAAECEYDPAARSVIIPGEVEMQFEIPGSSTAPSGNPPTSLPITVLTSGLSFDQASGIASTDAEVRLQSELGEGTSQGATYDPKEQHLILTSRVEFFLRDSPGAGVNAASATSPPREPTHLRAGALRFARKEGRIFLEEAVEITRGKRRVQANRGEVTLDAALQVRQVWLEGEIVASDLSLAHSAEARADRGRISFGQSGAMRTVELEQRVRWTMRALPVGPLREGSAERIELAFEEPGGVLARVLAERDVRAVFRDSAGVPSSADAAGRPNPNARKETQILTAQRAEMALLPDGKTFQRVEMTFEPRLESVPTAAGADRRTVTGNAFDIRFSPEGRLAEFAARGSVHVVTEDTGPAPRQRVTTSDSLAATFDPAGAVERVRQWGRFRYQDFDRQAQADQADYVVRDETILLVGSPRVWNAQGRVEAARMRLGTRNGSLEAETNVSSTYLPRPSRDTSAAEPLHVVADRLQYRSENDRAHYRGHARLWQGAGFLIEADSLEVRQKEGELFAQGGVYTVFRRRDPSAASPRGVAASPGLSAGSFVVRSDTLLYRHKNRLAHYSGGVRLENEGGRVSAGEVDVLFAAGPTGSLSFSGGTDQIERAVAQEDVRIVQGQRTATGDRAEYDPLKGQIRLFGNLATITDPARGTTRGVQLTYLLGDASIHVEGKPGLPTETRWNDRP